MAIKLRRMLTTCPYKTLGLGSDALQSDIKKQYTKMIFDLHPDRHKSRTKQQKQQFLDVLEAYKLLSTAESRRNYDMSQIRQSNSQTNAAAGSAAPNYRRYRKDDPFGHNDEMRRYHEMLRTNKGPRHPTIHVVSFILAVAAIGAVFGTYRISRIKAQRDLERKEGMEFEQMILSTTFTNKADPK
jgi:DnaJ-class molecular chaperone